MVHEHNDEDVHSENPNRQRYETTSAPQNPGPTMVREHKTQHCKTTSSLQTPVPTMRHMHRDEGLHSMDSDDPGLRPKRPYRNASTTHPIYSLIGGAVVVSISIVIAVLVHQRNVADLPYSKMFSLAIKEAADNDVSSISDLKIDDLDIYAQAACASGPTASKVRFALQQQMRKIPKEVRDDIIEMAVIDQVTGNNARQNTKASISTDGKAHSYMAFYSTAYNGEMTSPYPKYTTCVMLSGIELRVAEHIAEYKTTRETRQIGTEPCKCGLIRCATCPIFEPHIVREPVFKRHALTIKQQKELHRWMVKQATEQAMMVVGNREKIMGSVPDDALASLRWRKPSKYAYLGSDDNSEGSGGDSMGNSNSENEDMDDNWKDEV